MNREQPINSPIRRYGTAGLLLGLALLLLGGAMPGPRQVRNGLLAQQVAGYGFNLVTWEAEALSQKLADALNAPAAELSPADGAAEVLAYVARARALSARGAELSRLYSGDPEADKAAIAALEAEIAALRSEQDARRSQVEQIMEWQVRDELARAGLVTWGRVFPPVQFSFSEPPHKLVVSPRERIDQLYYRMLTPAMSLTAIEEAETGIRDEAGLSAYVASIGGLGAYPTMVIDRAGLPWLLNTVAHEWTHNYLTLGPLGIRYSASNELTIMNETVAEIVGDEIGAQALARYYPDVAAAQAAAAEKPSAQEEAAEEPVFDFNAEMRATRLEVDRLLAAGEVDAAEAYMEARRREFVANGYSLRVLNQAYFAFHGAYGSSPASSSPLAVQLSQLREQAPDVGAFLKQVRGFRSPDDLQAALDAGE